MPYIISAYNPDYPGYRVPRVLETVAGDFETAEAAWRSMFDRITNDIVLLSEREVESHDSIAALHALRARLEAGEYPVEPAAEPVRIADAQVYAFTSASSISHVSDASLKWTSSLPEVPPKQKIHKSYIVDYAYFSYGSEELIPPQINTVYTDEALDGSYETEELAWSVAIREMRKMQQEFATERRHMRKISGSLQGVIDRIKAGDYPKRKKAKNPTGAVRLAAQVR